MKKIWKNWSKKSRDTVPILLYNSQRSPTVMQFFPYSVHTTAGLSGTDAALFDTSGSKTSQS